MCDDDVTIRHGTMMCIAYVIRNLYQTGRISEIVNRVLEQLQNVREPSMLLGRAGELTRKSMNVIVYNVAAAHASLSDDQFNLLITILCMVL